MRTVELILIPFDSGRRGTRLGTGPERVMAAGLRERLRGNGLAVVAHTVEPSLSFPTENTLAFHLAGLIAERVREAREHGRFPLVLAGNCMSSLGVVAGLGSSDVGLVWLDSHGDFNTPETSPSGFLDGMALATAVGRCWTAAATTIPGHRPLPEANVLLLGARDLDQAERLALVDSDVALLGPSALADERSALEPALASLASRAACAYLHVDLDVLDPSVARINEYQAPHGLSLEQVREIFTDVGGALPIHAAAVTAYDADGDPEGKGVEAAMLVIERLVEVGASV